MDANVAAIVDELREQAQAYRATKEKLETLPRTAEVNARLAVAQELQREFERLEEDILFHTPGASNTAVRALLSERRQGLANQVEAGQRKGETLTEAEVIQILEWQTAVEYLAYLSHALEECRPR